MTLVREMPVNRVSHIIHVDDNKLWRMMHHYTEAARRKEDYSGVKQVGVDETSRAKGHDLSFPFCRSWGKADHCLHRYVPCLHQRG